MAEVRDLIGDALRELGVLAAGEVLTADEALHGLTALNLLMDSWATEELQVYEERRTTWTMVSGTQNYTVGTGGTVNRARPVYIDHVHFVDTSQLPSSEYQLQPLTDDAWAAVPIKDMESAFPTCWYYNPTFPLGTLTFWPVPTSSALTGVMYAPLAVGEFASLDTTVSLPPGYRRMIVKNLAVELAPSYERPAAQELIRQAMESKGNVKRANKRLMDMSIDAAALVQGGGGRFDYDIFTGP